MDLPPGTPHPVSILNSLYDSQRGRSGDVTHPKAAYPFWGRITCPKRISPQFWRTNAGPKPEAEDSGTLILAVESVESVEYEGKHLGVMFGGNCQCVANLLPIRPISSYPCHSLQRAGALFIALRTI